jgi:SAM-dependent methyltransferase
VQLSLAMVAAGRPRTERRNLRRAPATGGGYDPELYALVHRGTPGDLAFYARACSGARAVLELGCGYGRLLPALADVVDSYIGLDCDAGLLRLARRERAALDAPVRAKVKLRRADMRAFSMRERFDKILIPHSGLFCLQRDADVLDCLRCTRAHLRDDGELLLDGYAADGFHERSRPSDLPAETEEWLARVATAAAQYDVYERSRWDRRRQRMTVTYRHVPVRGGRPREGVIEHRYLMSAQLRALLERAGFAVTEQSGGFRGQRLSRRSELMVVRARIRPSPSGRRR